MASEVAIMAPGLTAGRLLARMSAWADRRLVMAAAADKWRSYSTCERALTMDATEHRLVGRASGQGLADLFWWWSDVPAYDRRDYEGFWKRLTSPSQWDFEHSAYLCYKLLAANWSLALINPLLLEAPNLHPELQTPEEFEVIKQMNPVSCCGLQGATLNAQAALEQEYNYSFQILNGHAMFNLQRNGGLLPEQFARRHKGELGRRWLILQLDHRVTHGKAVYNETHHLARVQPAVLHLCRAPDASRTPSGASDPSDNPVVDQSAAAASGFSAMVVIRLNFISVWAAVCSFGWREVGGVFEFLCLCI